MSEHLQAVTEGKITRLLINVPPGMMKSLIVNVFWPAWEWGAKKMPHLRYISAAHMQNLSIRDNIRMRRLVMSEWYRSRYPHVILMKDQNAKIKFENTETGFKEAIAAGSITGSRGDRVTIDDPLSVEDAQSKTILESREFWFTEAVPTRLNNPQRSAIVVIMQRLNEMDTSGLILDRNLGYEHLMLPMEFEIARKCKTLIGFEDPRAEEGELLFPERFPTEVVNNLKQVLGSYATAGQFQQRPSPRGGGLIKEAWFKYYKLKFDLRGNIDLKEFKLIYHSLDTAFKEKQENDASVIQVWGVKDDGYYLIFQWKGRVGYPELEDKAIKIANMFRPNAMLIEDKASGQSLLQSIKRKTNLPIKGIVPDRDKVARVHASTGYIEAGKVFLPEGETWVEDYITELTTFPAAAHDDQVDATTQFLMEVAIRREQQRQPISGSMLGR